MAKQYFALRWKGLPPAAQVTGLAMEMETEKEMAKGSVTATDKAMATAMATSGLPKGGSSGTV